jgi:hypothetical protein
MVSDDGHVVSCMIRANRLYIVMTATMVMLVLRGSCNCDRGGAVIILRR